MDDNHVPHPEALTAEERTTLLAAVRPVVEGVKLIEAKHLPTIFSGLKPGPCPPRLTSIVEDQSHRWIEDYKLRCRNMAALLIKVRPDLLTSILSALHCLTF